MKVIIGNGEIVAFCDEPRYIKRNWHEYTDPETGEKSRYFVYIQAKGLEDAEGIAAGGGKPYNLQGQTILGEDVPEAIVTERENWEQVFDDTNRINVNSEDIVNLTDAAMEFDTSIEDITDALCDLDK